MGERIEQLSDEELVGLVRAGQVDAFEHLYRRHYGRAYRVAYGMTGRREVAEELTQEVFMRAFERLNLFKGESKFSTWLHRVAVNHCLNHHARSRRDVLLRAGDLESEPLSDAAAGQEARLRSRQVQEQMHRALLELEPVARMVVILRDVEGLSYQEIAERLNCSAGTIASRLNRARRELARRLDHLRGTVS